jgi:hypothetical protein
MIFEKQRLPLSEKDEQWRKNCMNSLCMMHRDFEEDWFRMWQNARLKNNQIDQSEYLEYCDPLRLTSGEDTRRYVEMFNKTHNVIESLKGEEGMRGWTFNVIDMSNGSANEVVRARDKELMDYIDFVSGAEIEKVQLENQVKSGQIAPEQAKEEQARLEKKMQDRDKFILKPEDIKKKYSNYKTLKESATNKLLMSFVISQRLKFIKNATFEDAHVKGTELVEVYRDKHTGQPVVKQLDVLKCWFTKNADTPFVENGVYAGYKEEIPIADAVDLYAEHLKDEDIERLNIIGGRVYGLNAKFSSKHGESPSHWTTTKQFEYTNQHPLSTTPYASGGMLPSDGLYSSPISDGLRNNRTCIVYKVYWRSQRKVGFYTYINEEGQEATTIVADDFVIPEDARKESITKYMFGDDRSIYKWEDINGLPAFIEWKWIPEIWVGIRINQDIFVKIEPLEDAYQSLDNPYKVKLPIHGYVYNNRNSYSVSTMDRMKPYQKLLFIMMSKLLKLIANDKGVGILLNSLFLDKEIGYAESLQMFLDQQMLLYNPLAHSQGAANIAGQMSPATVVNLSNSQQIASYIPLIQFLENQMLEAAGVPKQKLAQTGSNTNVADNQRDMQQSFNITNSIDSAHELLWENILQTVCEILVKNADTKSNMVRDLLSDEEIAIIDLGLINLDDEYAVRCTNSTKNYKMLEAAKQYAQALIQNDKSNMSTLLTMLDTDNFADVKKQVIAYEYDLAQKEQQAQQAQQQHEKEIEEMKKETLREEREFQMQKEKLKGEFELKKAQIQAMAWDKEKDRDNNGVADVLEQDKLAMQKDKLAFDKSTEQQKLGLKERDLEAKQMKADADLQLNQQKLQLQQEKNKQQSKSK